MNKQLIVSLLFLFISSEMLFSAENEKPLLEKSKMEAKQKPARRSSRIARKGSKRVSECSLKELDEARRTKRLHVTDLTSLTQKEKDTWLVQAAKMEVIKRKGQLDRVIFSGEGNQLYGYMQKCRAWNQKIMQRQEFIIPSIDSEKSVMQIDSDGKLSVNQDENQEEHLIIVDWHDKIIFDSNLMDESEKLKRLQAGGTTAFFGRNLRVSITFNFVNKGLKRILKCNVKELGFWQALYDEDLVRIANTIQAGADVNELNWYGKTPLMWALGGNNFKMAQFLLENKADIDRPDKNGTPPLMWVLRSKNLEMLQFLVKNKADLNELDENGLSPLKWAIINNYIKVVRFLLKNKANFIKRDENGFSVLGWAMRTGYVKIVNLLAKENPKIRAAIEEDPELKKYIF